ncbi:MAG: ABC transporter permease subunit [Gluconobacter potus]|uniref:ABC transporter permease subunit n=1 Tax=Gluconobacter potus TaxID=2724927 RepID=A0ABR9YQG9_9PROT|nr:MULTISPECIES: ABC transporter permease subunit [Gluconobacter]MBF0865832.1 ABC transporter permease subunit [Gluconobacter sp. R71656]MBF0868956.1 ABC transporter permease subunit [Gluconobacter sp. R75628]MBF0874940.1 ABC transporter permease subunit [Gluconobacter sp. R75629]MBF0883869.1 ABC transporter permease subunit [Gluconobacter potus]
MKPLALPSGSRWSAAHLCGLSVVLVPTCFLAVLFIWPVLRLLALGFGDEAGPFHSYLRVFTVPAYREAILTTFEIAIAVTVLSVMLAYPVAYLMATVSPRMARLIGIGVLLPFWTSALVRTTAWIMLLERYGILNSVLMRAHLIRHPVAFVYNMSGVLIGMSHVLMPFVVFPLYTAFRGLDRNLVQAAMLLGAGPLTLCRKIFIPLTAPGALAGANIVFMSALGYYITPALMGGPAQTMVSQLISFNVSEQLDWGMAGALSGVMLVLTLAAFFLCRGVLEKRLKRRVVTAARPYGEGLSGRSGAGWGMVIAGCAVMVFLLAPIVIVFPMSVSASPILMFPPHGLSFRWYHELLSRPQWAGAFFNSLKVALIAVPVATVLGTLAAIGLARMKGTFAQILEGLFILPMVVPAIILAVGLYYQLTPLGLTRGYWGLGLGQAVIAMPFVFLTVQATLRGFSRDLELAAMSLGAGWFSVMGRIVLPALMPAIVSGAIFAFITSFDDVILALFLTDVRARTLSRLIYENVLQDVSPTITAVAVLVIVLTLGLLLSSLLFQREKS